MEKEEKKKVTKKSGESKKATKKKAAPKKVETVKKEDLNDSFIEKILGEIEGEDKAKKEAQSIAEQSQVEVKSLKDEAMANVDEAASIIVKNIL